MLRVVFTGSFAARFEEPVRAHLKIPCELIVDDHGETAAPLAEAEVVVTLVFTREMGAAARRLKLVQVPGIGLDRIDRDAVPRGAWLANIAGHEVGIAEYVIGTVIALTRDFYRLDSALRRGEWRSPWAGAPPPAPWPELAGKTIGILGYGRIGQAVAHRARAFDMTVWAMRRDTAQPAPEAPAFLGGPGDLDKILGQSDYLVITLSLTAATRGLLGDRELRLMKPSAFLVNVARAEIIDEEALYRALAEKTIAGAALDVWYRYPGGAGPALPAHHPFHELRNVLMTPHVSGWTQGMLEARAKLIAENIDRISQNMPPLNLVR